MMSGTRCIGCGQAAHVGACYGPAEQTYRFERQLRDRHESLHAVARAVREGYNYTPGDSDLDNEQPISVHMTLGDYRKAARLVADVAAPKAPEDR